MSKKNKQIEREIEDEARELEVKVDRQLEQRLNAVDVDSEEFKAARLQRETAEAAEAEKKALEHRQEVANAAEAEQKDAQQKLGRVYVISPAYLFHDQDESWREQIERVLPFGTELEVLERSEQGRMKVRLRSAVPPIEGYVDPSFVDEAAG